MNGMTALVEQKQENRGGSRIGAGRKPGVAHSRELKRRCLPELRIQITGKTRSIPTPRLAQSCASSYSVIASYASLVSAPVSLTSSASTSMMSLTESKDSSCSICLSGMPAYQGRP